MFAFHNFQHLIAFYGFPFNQGAGHGFHLVAVFIQDFVGNRILLVQNPTDFRIHILLGFLGNILRTCHAAAQEHLTLVFGIHHHTHFLAHAVAGNHFPGNLGGTFEVVGRAGGNAADKQVFGNASAEQNRNLVQHLVFIHADAVAFRQLPCQTQSAAARHNGYLVHRIGTFQAFRHNRMAGFMVGSGAFFVLVHNHAAPFGTHVDFVFSILKITLIHFQLIAAAGKQGGLIDQVGQVRTRKTRCTARQRSQIHRFVQRHFFRMHFQNLFAAADIGQRHHHLAVETARAQQRGIEYVRTVGRGNHNYGLIAFKTVHFHQKLVQSLFAFVVTAAQTGTALAADGIDFVNKDDARRIFLCLLEHIAHTAGTYADEHFDKIRTGNAEKRHTGFTGNRFGQKGFTRTRAARQQNAARHPPA